jgi:transcriptional regulator with XRE-family HTH domain
LHAISRQHIHSRTYVQASVSGRPYQSSQIQAGCGTFLLYSLGAQAALSRLEAGGVIPTIPLLERISAALDADLIVAISPYAA